MNWANELGHRSDPDPGRCEGLRSHATGGEERILSCGADESKRLLFVVIMGFLMFSLCGSSLKVQDFVLNLRVASLRGAGLIGS